MSAKSGFPLYRLNLIRELRERELKSERQHRLALILGLGCFGFFLLAVLYSGITIWQMESVLDREERKLANLHEQYQQYTAARLIVDKSDLELLNNLQIKGVFWTRKLAAMAKHLPNDYTITTFSYRNSELRITGYGFASQRQDQLLILDRYLNALRTDTTFSDTFKKVLLTAADRKGEAGRVAFEFSAYTADWKP